MCFACDYPIQWDIQLGLGFMIVVTGGSGFVGAYVCNHLAEQGHSVRIIDIAPPPFGVKAEFVRASVLDVARLARLVPGAEAIIHLAALVDVNASVEDPFSDFQVNVQGTLNVLEAAKSAGIEKVSYASSAAVYGEPVQIPISEDHPTEPSSPYGLSKLCAERYVLLYNKLYGMKNNALRLFNVYGKGQSAGSPYSGVITKFTDAISSNRQPIIFGDGSQTRDFVHAKDVANAFSLSLQRGGFDFPLNIGAGMEISVLSLLEKMSAISSKEANPKFMPQRKGEIKRSIPDISLAGQKLGYYPKIEFEEGLREILSERQ